jgi:7,8-dihydropterin-6-yl-methyl-4-(beta-D-ribofuranosyl)aminobenzene 5'-phosphate synthase
MFSLKNNNNITMVSRAVTRVKKLTITTVADNLVYEKGFGQSGMSLLLELIDARGDPRKVIFDTGDNKEALMHNMKSLRLNPREIDAVVLSHGHWDHTAAIVEVVKAAGSIKVHGHPQTFIQRYVKRNEKRGGNIGVHRSQGIVEIEKAGGNVALSARPVEVVPGLWTTGQIERETFETAIDLPDGGKFIIYIDGKEVEDNVLDDTALWMDVEGVGCFVATGCAHAGPINTLKQVQRIGSFDRIYGLIGGTHMLDRSDDYLQRTIIGLKEFGLSLISPCHCTGWKATTRFWQAFPEEFVLNYCCRIIEARKRPKQRVW